MCKVNIAYIVYPSWNIIWQEVNLESTFKQNHTSFKNQLPPKENPTHDFLVRYTSYDPKQGNRIKAYASDLPFPRLLKYKLQRQAYTTAQINLPPISSTSVQHRCLVLG